MSNVLRPSIEHVDYLPSDMEVTPEELKRIREMSVEDPTSVYHGFPEVQIEMIREEGGQPTILDQPRQD
jgi:hypothetical protein